MAREFKATQAFRHAVPLLIGIAGPPGSGKTYSALTLATGIKAHRGGPIIVIDTERDRALRYAPPAGVTPNGVDHFDFLHVPFAPDFGSLDFLAAVQQQRPHRPSCIVIDSMSDEHEGEGGLLDFHDRELSRMAGDDWAKRERVGQAAWIKPKAQRLEMLNGLMQIKTPLIFCFRAREKTKQIANDRGKQVPTNIGWTPIAPPEIVHSMDIFALLPIKSDGVPMWKGNTAYEDFSIKLPRQFQNLFPADKAINRQMGQAMSVWALGDQKLDTVTDTKKGEAPKTDDKSNAQPDTRTDTNQGPQAHGTAAAQAADPGSEGEAATPASEPSTATADGTPATGDDTGAADGQDAPVAAEPEPVDGMVSYARAVAVATDWPTILAPLTAICKSDTWRAAAEEQRSMIRRIAFERLNELVRAGLKFDFLTDLQAWRCYIEWEVDPDAMEGNRNAIVLTDAWKALDRLPGDAGTKSKMALDQAYGTRVAALKAAAEQGEYA